MILSEEDKDRFHEVMNFFQPLLEKEVKGIITSLELKLISFAIQVDNEFLYFDYPYTKKDGGKVNMINASLEDDSSKFYKVDEKIYSLLDCCPHELKYIAYNFQDDDYPVKISNKIYSCLSPGEILENTDSTNYFFPVMYYSAFPDKHPAIDFEEVEVEILNSRNFKKWFIVIHNEDIEDSSNKIISNYCLILNSDFETLDKKLLNRVAVKLKTFSKYYGSKDFNVILRKNVEYSDSILSLNTEIYHHIKELNSNLSLIPIQKLKNKYSNDQQVLIVERNLLRIQDFYENYVQFLKTKSSSQKESFDSHQYFNDPKFDSFKKDICNTVEGLNIEINIESTIKCITIIQYFDIILKEIVLNGVKSFIEQDIKDKKIVIHSRDSEDGLLIVITSCGSRYKKNHLLPFKYLGLKMLQANSITGECGSGLYLLNKLLSQMGAIHYPTEIGNVHFKASTNYDGNSGFTLEFILPKQ